MHDPKQIKEFKPKDSDILRQAASSASDGGFVQDTWW